MLQLRSHSAYPYIIRILLVGVVIVLCFQVTQVWRTMEYGAPGTTDFIAFWSAGQLLRHGENPHDVEQLLRLETRLGRADPLPLVMVNPTWMLVWLFPLFLVDFHTAALCWLGTNLAIVLAASSLLWLIFTPHQTKRGFAIAWIASIAFAPVLFTLRMGQTTGLALLGIVGFLFFSRKELDLCAGAFLALATAKPHVVYLMWMVVIWWTLVERRWKVLVGCLGVLTVSGVALTAMRPRWIADYRMALNDLPLYWATPTIGGVLRWSLGIQTSQVQFVAPALTGLLVLSYLLRTRPVIAWKQAIGPILLLSIATAAYGWTYDQIVLLVPYLQMVAWLWTEADYSKADRVVVIGGLLLYSGVLIVQNLLKVSMLFDFWTPWVLAGTYAYAWLRREPISASRS